MPPRHTKELQRYLAEFDGADIPPSKVTYKLMKKWLDSAYGSKREQNRAMVFAGRALLTQHPGTDIMRWTDRVGNRLVRTPRTIRFYQDVAARIDDPELATPLPLEILDCPLRGLLGGIERVQQGEPPCPARKQTGRRGREEVWKETASRLLTGADKLPDGEKLLSDQIVQSHARLATIKGRKDVGDASDSDSLKAGTKRKPAASPKTAPPLIAYRGGKTEMAKDIVRRIGDTWSHYDDADREYREPFVGGGSVLMNLIAQRKVRRVWLNDADPAMATLWTTVIQNPRELAERLEATPSLDSQSSTDVADLRGQMKAGLLSGVNLAYARLVLADTTFRSAGSAESQIQPKYKLDKKGKSLLDKYGNKIPNWKMNSLRHITRIMTVHNYMKTVEVHDNCCTNLDALDVISAPGLAVMFLDPPYVEVGKDFFEYNFKAKHHVKLAATLHETEQPWLMTIDDDRRTKQMKKGGNTGWWPFGVKIRQLYEDDYIWPILTAKGRKTKEVFICPVEYREWFDSRLHDDLMAGILY